MIVFSSIDKQSEIKKYCQNWLAYLASGEFEKAAALVDVPNCYNSRWSLNDLHKVLTDYFNKEEVFTFQNLDIAKCYPEFMECDDGRLIFGFYLPANDELTDLTVEFEFKPNGNGEFLVSIYDVHVM